MVVGEALPKTVVAAAEWDRAFPRRSSARAPFSFELPSRAHQAASSHRRSAAGGSRARGADRRAATGSFMNQPCAAASRGSAVRCRFRDRRGGCQLDCPAGAKVLTRLAFCSVVIRRFGWYSGRSVPKLLPDFLGDSSLFTCGTDRPKCGDSRLTVRCSRPELHRWSQQRDVLPVDNFE
jgi:hypothetical protein